MRKEEVKVSLFVHDMTLHREILKTPPKKKKIYIYI